jgi:hypothetical protein
MVVNVRLTLVLVVKVPMRSMGMGQSSMIVFVLMTRAEVIEAAVAIVIMGYMEVIVRVHQLLVLVLVRALRIVSH